MIFVGGLRRSSTRETACGATRTKVLSLRGDYAFSSHPFSDMPNRQLMYAAELGWFDAGKLEGFADEACEILAEGDLCRWRLDYLREGIRQRIGAVRGLLS